MIDSAFLLDESDNTMFDILVQTKMHSHVVVILHLDDISKIPYTWFHFVKGFITTGVSPDELKLAVQAVNQGRRFWSSAVIELIIHQQIELEVSQKLSDVYIKIMLGGNIKNIREDLHLDILTETEQEIFNLIIRGKSNKEIGDTLHVSINTVKSHVSRIFTKLDVNNRTELILFALGIS